jgi:rhomboid family protein
LSIDYLPKPKIVVRILTLKNETRKNSLHPPTFQIFLKKNRIIDSMIPLKDNISSETLPFVNYTLIAINLAVFILQLAMGSNAAGLVSQFGLIPYKVTAGGFGPQYAVLPFFTSMFLHGGWMHLIGNMLFLWIFGDNVEDRMGHFFYLLFYFGSGFGASLLHIVTAPNSPIPTIGASGAIAGVMGAYFVLYPRARVLSLIIIVIFVRTIEIPAIVFLGIWFAMQFFMGLADMAARGSGEVGGIAFWAHVGGFVVGVVGGGVARLFTGSGRPRNTKKSKRRQRVEVITKEGKRYYH